MCGIVGLIDQAAGVAPPALLAAMRDCMALRGPDGEGHYFEGPVGLAMRRLSVIDLAGGQQPFFSRGRQIVAFQNGEIYNYRELRRELEAAGHTFISQSDTEVLAHGYAAWGAPGLLERLDGMFALAILDREQKTLCLARDRFGEKPLFYAQAPGRFAFASSLTVLAALPWVADDLDPIALEHYLALHYVGGERTILRAVRRVLPGEYLSVPLEKPEPRRTRYYRPLLRAPAPRPDEELEQLLDHAVASRLIADVPVGVFLSGGLDSSLVAALAAKKVPRIATFSIGFASSSHDESPYAELVARHVGSSHHHFHFDVHAFLRLLPEVVAHLDEPLGDQASLPLYWLCREARRVVTVALSGEGADEVFGGYSYYAPFAGRQPLAVRLRAHLARRAIRPTALKRLLENPWPITPSGFPLLTDAAERRGLLETPSAGPNPWEDELLAWLDTAPDSLQRATAADLATWLPDDLLVKFDRMSMAHSLEGRAPYLAPGVVEAGLHLLPADRWAREASKVALRRVAKRHLPGVILDRPKQAWVLPMAAWLKEWFQQSGAPREYFHERAMPGLRNDAVATLVQGDLDAGVRRERLTFALVVLYEWYRSFQAARKTLAESYARA